MDGATFARGTFDTGTFPSVSATFEESVAANSEDSLAGYSPSPAGSPITRRGFNLLVPEGMRLDGAEPEHNSEIIAVRALRDRWLWEEDLMSLTEFLPSSTRDFQQSVHGVRWSCSFLTGAFIHGVSAGVTNNARNFPMVTSLVTAVLRSVSPTSWFSSAGISLNLRSRLHRDSNNSAIIENTLVPASDFVNGELWLEDSTGSHEMEGYLGR